jgi:hypothetical protein
VPVDLALPAKWRLQSVIVIRRFAKGGYFFVLVSDTGDLLATSQTFDTWAASYMFRRDRSSKDVPSSRSRPPIWKSTGGRFR